MSGSNPFVAEIGIAGFNFAPKGWALCNGQILPISQNTALFSLLGTTYGGDGKSTFALPDLQGRVAIHSQQGPGLSLYDLGQSGGSETQTLLTANMPNHSHPGEQGVGGTLTQQASIKAGTSANPDGRIPASTGTDNRYAATSNATMASYPLTLQPTGGDQPFSIMQPYLTLTFCIALQGVYPQRP